MIKINGEKLKFERFTLRNNSISLIYLRVEKHGLYRDRCMSRKRNRRTLYREVGSKKGAAYASKIQLVESVIMNNASCAHHTHSRKSLSALHRYCIGKEDGDCGGGKRGGRVTAGSLHAVNFLRIVTAYAHHARLYTVNKGNTTAFLFVE